MAKAVVCKITIAGSIPAAASKDHTSLNASGASLIRLAPLAFSLIREVLSLAISNEASIAASLDSVVARLREHAAQMTARISPARASVVAAVGSLLFLAALPSQAHERPQWPGLGCDEALTVAAPFTETPPVLDGVLGEGEWDGAAQLTGFRRLYPDRGVEVALPTVVHVLAGDGHLYVAFDCEIAGASKVRATETREDARLSDQDRVEVIIDSLHDHRRAIELQTSPAGVKSDRTMGQRRVGWDLGRSGPGQRDKLPRRDRHRSGIAHLRKRK